MGIIYLAHKILLICTLLHLHVNFQLSRIKRSLTKKCQITRFRAGSVLKKTFLPFFKIEFKIKMLIIRGQCVYLYLNQTEDTLYDLFL